MTVKCTLIIWYNAILAVPQNRDSGGFLIKFPIPLNPILHSTDYKGSVICWVSIRMSLFYLILFFCWKAHCMVKPYWMVSRPSLDPFCKSRAASGVAIDIDHNKINQISTTQHFIDQNIDHKSSLKGMYLLHYTFRDQREHAHFGRTVIYPISHFHFFKFNTLREAIL